MNKKIRGFNTIFFLLFVIILSVSSQARADWASDFLDQMKNNTNLQKSSNVETQGSYGYHGGGFSYTYQNQTLQPFNVKAPSMSAGCGGISFDFGAFEFLNEESLVAFLEQLLQAAPGYAFELAMQILCPSCLDIMNTMNQIANTLNGLQFDACGTMEALSGLASDSFNQWVSTAEGQGYANYKQATEDYINKPLQKFNEMLDKAFSCIEGKEGCPKQFFQGDKSLMQTIVESMDPSVKKEFGAFLESPNISDDELAQVFRAIFGDMAFTKRTDATAEDAAGSSEAHLVTYPGRFVNTAQVAAYLAFGDFGRTVQSPGNIEEVDLVTATFTPDSGKEGSFFKHTGWKYIKTFSQSAREKLDSITEKFVERETLSDDELLWLTLFKSPVYKAFNMYSISNEALKSFSNNFKTVAGVQMVYEFLSNANTEILAGLAKFQQGVETAGYWSAASNLPEETKFFKDRLRTMVENSYSMYIEAYDLFSQNMQDNNEMQRLQNLQKGMYARHPVLGKKMFTPGF